MPSLFLVALVLISSLASVNADAEILPLKKFSSLATSVLNNLDAGANLYLASNDDNKVLKNIKVTTGGNIYSLDQLNDFNDDGTPKSLKISGGLAISTTNDDTVTNKLTGNLYVTTRMQADDADFHVYVIKTQHSISVNAMKSTVVILNTEYLTYLNVNQPLKNSYVTQIDQSSNTNLYFQSGIPAANWHDVTDNIFFTNPINLKNDTTTARLFFDHVEPLQIGLDFWYFTVMGPTNMIIENKYVDDLTYQTTAVSTTGLVMNDFIFHQHVVNFQPDPTKTGSSGFITTGFLEADVTFSMNSGGAIVSEYSHGNGKFGDLDWTVAQATQLTINASSTVPGTFYCQYFTIAGDLLPLTTPQTTTFAPTTTGQTSTVASTTTPVATTTKGSADLFGMKLITLLIVAVQLL